MSPWCNGVVIKAHIAPRLMVVAHEIDGRWTAYVVGTFSVGGVKETDVWEFDANEVKALLLDKQPTPQAREGQPKTASAVTWIDYVCPNGEWRLMTAKAVHGKIVSKAKELKVQPRSYSAVADALRERKRQT